MTHIGRAFSILFAAAIVAAFGMLLLQSCAQSNTQVSSVAIDETPAAGAVSVPPTSREVPVAGDPNLSSPAQTPSPVTQSLNRGAGVFS